MGVTELEAIVASIADQVRRQGGRASAERVGELALRGLIPLDRVAAIRFASVYRNFEDLAQFEGELRRLEREPVATADQLDLEGASAVQGTSDPGASIGPSAAGPLDRAERQADARRRGHAART